MQIKIPLEQQLVRLALCTSVPLLLILLWTMVYGGISIWLILLTLLVSGGLISYTAYLIHRKLTYQFRSVSNLVSTMAHGDYSLRARRANGSGAVNELTLAVNTLAERLSHQRWESIESQLLLQTIIEHIDVAILALNESGELRLLNPAARTLLNTENNDATSSLQGQLSFLQTFTSGEHQVVELSFGHQQGRFNIHVEEFREAGKQHKLLFITDVRRLLRREENKAWQSLVRVISHEINNSLSPIASLSQTLMRLIQKQPEHIAGREDLLAGLNIISERATGLGQFIDSYKQLAKLPEPQKQPTSIFSMINKVCALLKETTIEIETADDVIIDIDPLQMEQVMINLLKNAVEAMAHTNPRGRIYIAWTVKEAMFQLTLCDEGCGISNLDNMFVPFYSTKKHGTGIGLVLCRQIIEAHDGRITITNQTNAPGCCVRIELPLSLTTLPHARAV